MDRRQFLHSLAALPGVVLLERTQTRPRGSVVVAGAGLAGLMAAYELDRAGYDVTLLEARARAGGRVYTMREPFSDGLYAEAGAARIQDTHEFTLRFVKQFGLTLDPFFPTAGARVTRVKDKRITGAIDLAQVPLEFSDEERKLGFGGSLGKYLFGQLRELGNPAEPGWPTGDLTRFETSIDEHFARQGASAGIRYLIALGHDLHEMSALQFLRDAALGAATKVFFKIRGGNDLLPKAFAAALSNRIHYGARLVGVEQDASSVRATFLRGTVPVTLSADYLVCTLPPVVLRDVEMPSMSAGKRAALQGVGGLSMARVFLQTRKRFWLDRGETGFASTDDPIDVWDYTRDQPGTRGILGAYTSGRMAERITALDPAERGKFLLPMMERTFPGTEEQFEVSASHSWISDPFSRGAAVAFGPGQLTRHYQALRAAEGRIHFAGEHTSPWAGWMNGGLESGARAAAEIQARA